MLSLICYLPKTFNALIRLLDVDIFDRVDNRLGWVCFKASLRVFNETRFFLSFPSSPSFGSRSLLGRFDMVCTKDLTDVGWFIWSWFVSHQVDWSKVAEIKKTNSSLFNSHLYLHLIDYCGVAPLVELCYDQRVLVWIDYSAMRLWRQCLSWWSVSSCWRDLMPKQAYCWRAAVAFFLAHPKIESKKEIKSSLRHESSRWVIEVRTTVTYLKANRA